MIFLIEYHRRDGRLMHLASFPDGLRPEAEAARLALETRRLHEGVHNEVVLLQAESEADLRRGHRRYFESLGALASPLA